MTYSVIIPCYKSSKTIGKVVDLLQQEMSQYKKLQIILVEDGSPDGGETVKAIKNLVNKYQNVLGIFLAKNTGQHNAILCGLNYAKGDYVISIDDDLQTHPSQIKKLIAKMDEGFDIVFAFYSKKKESSFRILGSKFNAWSVRQLIGKPKWLKTSSFWIIKRFVRDSVVEYKNSYAFITGLLLRTTDNIGNVEVEHYKREIGKSGYDLKHLVKLWSNIIGFSVKPIRVVSVAGILFAIFGFILTLVMILKKLFFNIQIQGWTSIMASISFFSGTILLSMGLVGEYVGRLFLAENNQPQYVIKCIEENKTNMESYNCNDEK